MTTTRFARFSRVLLAMTCALLISAVLVVPAHAAGGNQADRLTGTIAGHAGPRFVDTSCPVKIEGEQQGMRQLYTGTIVHQGRPETIDINACVICCSPGGADLPGTFAITTPGGTLTGDANGHVCTCDLADRMSFTLTATNGTRGLAHTAGAVFTITGSFVGGNDTIDGPFTPDTTLTTG